MHRIFMKLLTWFLCHLLSRGYRCYTEICTTGATAKETVHSIQLWISYSWPLKHEIFSNCLNTAERNLWAWAASLSSVQWRPEKLLTASHVRITCLKSHFTLVLSPSWDQVPLAFNFNKKREEIDILRNGVIISSIPQAFMQTVTFHIILLTCGTYCDWK